MEKSARRFKAQVLRYFAAYAVFFALLLLPYTSAIGAELLSQAQFILKSPDVSVSGTYDLPGHPSVLDGLLRSPILLAQLWEAYGYAPPYKARLQGQAIHVDDPTGIAGDIFLVEQSGNRRLYLGIGALNHRLVPAFQGKMALVLTATPKGSVISTRIDVSIRTESRVLGFLTRTLFPLVRARIENRMTVNARDIAAILNVISTAPQDAASRLKSEDAAALMKLLAPPPPAKGGSKSK